MAIGTNLPPQAFTRETLTQAFAWLQTQPESVRRIATTPEVLVSLYTRNQRFGSASTAPISPLAGDTDLDSMSSPSEAPVSAQNFKTDLKTLAEGLKQFEDPRGSRIQSQSTQQPVSQPAQRAQQPAAPVNMAVGIQGLQPSTQAMIQEVKNNLNLSNDNEAINMMVAIAYKNLKTLLA